MADRSDDSPPRSPAEAAEWLRKHFDAAAAAGCRASFVLELSGPRGGTIGVQVADGSLELAEGDARPVDVRFRIAADDFYDVLSGRANADLLFLEERLQVEGELALALRFRRLFGARG